MEKHSSDVPAFDGFEETGLVYVSDATPGIRRRRCGRGFIYLMPDGSRLTDPAICQRIRRLGLPPAYRDVWICIQPNGHLQATGYDAEGRKQYCYHAQWESWRSTVKFRDLPEFGTSLPRLRRQILADLEAPASDARFLLAALAYLLDAIPLRVGNRSYALTHGTYGATTLLKRHLSVEDNEIRIRFAGKGGKRVTQRLRSPRLARILEDVADLPGRELFSWRDDDGILRRVDSGQLNRYLSGIAGRSISAKIFRTWAGSVAGFRTALDAFRENRAPKIREICTAAADVLHNTPTICRSSYVHPAILGLAEYDAEQRQALLERTADVQLPHGLRADERRLLAFLGEAVNAPAETERDVLMEVAV